MKYVHPLWSIADDVQTGWGANDDVVGAYGIITTTTKQATSVSMFMFPIF
jgi:hypothetical protein